MDDGWEGRPSVAGFVQVYLYAGSRSNKDGLLGVPRKQSPSRRAIHDQDC